MRGHGAMTHNQPAQAMKKTRNHVNDLRAASRLAVEATKGVTDLVEAMHRESPRRPDVLGRPLAGPTRLITGLIYGGIRGVTGLVGAGIDLALGAARPLLGESAPGIEREAVLAALNGVLGDYLAETGNPLAIPMRLRHGGHPLELVRPALTAAFPQAGGKLLVMAHGSSLSDRQWNRLGHDHGAALARDLGATAIYLHYNSGLHISTNGRGFAVLLEQLVAEWPVAVEELAIVGHSMGGLVARSACHPARRRRTSGVPSCASWSVSVRRTTERRWSAAATGSTSCLALAATALRWGG